MEPGRARRFGTVFRIGQFRKACSMQHGPLRLVEPSLGWWVLQGVSYSLMGNQV